MCIAANRNLQVAHCPDLEVNDLEAVWAQVQTHHHSPVYICSVYRPPDKGPDYIELLRQPYAVLHRRHSQKPPLMIIGGDLNYPLINRSTLTSGDSAGDTFLDILDDFHLQQFVSTLTRHGDSTSSILDLVLSSYPSSIDKVDNGREFSDHCLVLFHVLLVPAATQSRTRKIFLYNKGDYDQLRATLSDFCCTFFNSSPEANSVDAN